MRVASWLMTLGLFSAPGQLITFDTLRPGSVPPGWVTTTTDQGPAPKWEVVKDTSAPSPPYVLGQVSTDSNRNRFPLAILNQPVIRDGEVSVRVKPVAGREDRAGGVIWRYRDQNNYYLVRANALQKNVAVYKFQDGKPVPLVPKGLKPNQFAVPHDIHSNAWSILKVVFRGPQYSIYVNHRRILQGTDNTFKTAGRIGLWTQADSVTYFDDFRFVSKQ